MENHFRHSQINPERRHQSNTKKFAVAVIGLLVIVLTGYFWYQNSRYQYLLENPVDATDQTKATFLIKTGENINQIAKKLTDKNLILDSDAFAKYLKEKGLDRKVVAGRFMLSRSQTIPQIAETLSDSKNSQAVVTIPEGSDIRDIDKKLVDLGLIQPNQFITATRQFNAYEKYPFLDKEKIQKLPYPLEGYLFPDTYFVDPTNFNCDELISLMLKNFKNRLVTLGLDEAAFTKPSELLLNINGQKHSLYGLVTMASIVEKEVRTAKDLPVVAGILWKRVDEHWQMGADATLLYLNNSDREIEYKDLQDKNPYNTRIILGLPPGPINNPGIKALEAALNTKSSPYYYYLTKPDTGEVVYAVTNDEHNQNKAKYLQ